MATQALHTCSATHSIFSHSVAIGHTRCAASCIVSTVEILLESACLGLIDPTALCNQLFLSLAVLAITETPHISKMPILG